MNRFAGGVVGVGAGILVVWVLFVAIMLLYDTSVGVKCFSYIESNEILNFLYQKNPFMKLVIKF